MSKRTRARLVMAGGVASGALALVCLGALAVGAVHGGRAASAQGSPAQVSAWRLDAAYYGCLATQVHTLIGPGQVVDVSTADPGAWVTLDKVVAPFAVITTRRAGHVVLTLANRPGPGSCLGSVVVARGPSGVVRIGTGGSLGGHRMPPQTPL
jgi:hypothetical protein